MIVVTAKIKSKQGSEKDLEAVLQKNGHRCCIRGWNIDVYLAPFSGESLCIHVL